MIFERKYPLCYNIPYDDASYGSPVTTVTKTRYIATDGRKVRPHVVFFGEDVPNLPLAASYVKNADICIVIGTSFNVYPAAGLVGFVDPDNPIYYIDPSPAPTPEYPDIQVIKATATAGMKELTFRLKENEGNNSNKGDSSADS